MNKNLSTLSARELKSVISKAQKELEKKKSKENKAVIIEIKKLAASIGMSVTLAEKGTKTATAAPAKKRAPKKSTGKVAPKYRNPANASETWSGRGLKPKWLQAELNAGKSLDDFKI